jgi:hypothetical protein
MLQGRPSQKAMPATSPGVSPSVSFSKQRRAMLVTMLAPKQR